MSTNAAFIPKLFLGGALLGAIGCLARADYNLPLFLFAYIAWNYLRVSQTSLLANLKKQQFYVVALFAFSLFVDIIWFFFINGAVWNSTEYGHLAPWERGVHKTAFWMCLLNFILKVRSG